VSDHPIPPPPDGRAFRQAVLNGEGDPVAALRDYLEEAEPRLHELLTRVGSLEHDDFNLLGWLDGSLIALLSTLQTGGRYRLQFAVPPGNRARTLDERLRVDAAAIEVISMVRRDGTNQQRALGDVAGRTGLSESQIKRRIAHFRRVGDRSVQQPPGS
jgi:hypothetical protein